MFNFVKCQHSVGRQYLQTFVNRIAKLNFFQLTKKFTNMETSAFESNIARLPKILSRTCFNIYVRAFKRHDYLPHSTYIVLLESKTFHLSFTYRLDNRGPCPWHPRQYQTVIRRFSKPSTGSLTVFKGTYVLYVPFCDDKL